MQTTQQFTVTDSNGLTVGIEFSITHYFYHYLRDSNRADRVARVGRPWWRALSLGRLGAQSGRVNVVPAGGDLSAARTYHLELKAILRGGHENSLIVLKRWMTNNGCVRSGTGTLYHGVNLGLRAGEVTWSETSHHRNAWFVGDVDVHGA